MWLRTTWEIQPVLHPAIPWFSIYLGLFIQGLIQYCFCHDSVLSQRMQTFNHFSLSANFVKLVSISVIYFFLQTQTLVKRYYGMETFLFGSFLFHILYNPEGRKFLAWGNQNISFSLKPLIIPDMNRKSPHPQYIPRKIFSIFGTIPASFQVTQIMFLYLSTPFSPCKDESIIFLLLDIQCPWHSRLILSVKCY